MGCAETREPKDHTSEYLPMYFFYISIYSSPPTGPGAIAYNLSRLNISNH